MSKCGCPSELVEEGGKPHLFRQAQYDHALFGYAIPTEVEGYFYFRAFLFFEDLAFLLNSKARFIQ